jgi:two-component system alkaline phosphatase synthesis response regulator PhoP
VATILVLDDDPSVRELCETVLAGEGFAVVTAADARSGIQTACDAKPDLILLDIMMPGVDGIDALHQLKNLPATAAIPVIMLTALDGFSDIAVATMGGADGYVTKPFEPEELASLVQRFLHPTRPADQRPG